jgi:hypothetical protein
MSIVYINLNVNRIIKNCIIIENKYLSKRKFYIFTGNFLMLKYYNIDHFYNIYNIFFK